MKYVPTATDNVGTHFQADRAWFIHNSGWSTLEGIVAQLELVELGLDNMNSLHLKPVVANHSEPNYHEGEHRTNCRGYDDRRRFFTAGKCSAAPSIITIARTVVLIEGSGEGICHLGAVY